MKERLQKFWKKNGFAMVLMSPLLVVVAVSGIAGYRDGQKGKATEQNAAKFAQVEGCSEGTVENMSGQTSDIQNVSNNQTEDAEAANADVAETFGEEVEMVIPTEGDVLKPFSMDTTIYYETLDQYKCNPAMLIQADVNQEVVAAFGGKVESISEDRVNGIMIKVDMGNGYKATYAQMKDVGVKEGDVIAKGQVLGNVAEPTSYFSEEGSHLYFALTKDDVPVDPSEYFEK